MDRRAKVTILPASGVLPLDEARQPAEVALGLAAPAALARVTVAQVDGIGYRLHELFFRMKPDIAAPAQVGSALSTGREAVPETLQSPAPAPPACSGPPARGHAVCSSSHGCSLCMAPGRLAAIRSPNTDRSSVRELVRRDRGGPYITEAGNHGSLKYVCRKKMCM